MNAHDDMDELVSRWQEAAVRGADLPAAELCRDRPDLLPDLERRIANLRRLEQALHDNPTQTPSAGPLRTPNTLVTDSSLATPSSLPGFEIQGELGRGGMGVVYRAYDTHLQRPVAIKQLLVGGTASAEQLARFLTEAQAIARLQHPHIVQVYQSGERDGQPFFVLEFVPGGSLDGKLTRGQPQPLAESARLVMLLARAVHAAHERGIIHRDLKPANVLLAPPADEPALNTIWGCPKVADFGLARLRDGEAGSVVGTVMGTPEYMAPEQAEGRVGEIGPASDVWSLGVMLYELLTGRRPFQGDSLITTAIQVCLEEPTPVRQLRPDAPEALAAVVSRCLQKRPENRYASAAAMADDLKRFLAGEETPTTGYRSPWRRSLRAWSAAVAGMLLVAAGILLWSGLGRTPNPEPTPSRGSIPPLEEPLSAELSVETWTTKDASKRGLKVEVEGSGALPVRNGERVQLTARLSSSAYPYLFWIDAEGEATPLYPWNDNDDGDIENDLSVSPPQRPAVREVRSPKREGQGWLVLGKSGLVSAVLLVRREPLRTSEELAELLAGMKAKWKAAPVPGGQDVMVRGYDRGRVNEAVSVERTRGLGKKAGEVNDAVLQLRNRLSDQFEVIRSVSFAQVGEPKQDK